MIGSRTIDFGKIDYFGRGRKVNSVTLCIELRPSSGNEKCPVFSVSADVWNHIHTDIVMGGQCLDELKDFALLKHNKLFQTIYELWKKYHLNDLHAGTVNQEAALEECDDKDYLARCAFLEKKGLLYDNGYKYGTSWLYREIPAEDLKTIESIISGNFPKQ